MTKKQGRSTEGENSNRKLGPCVQFLSEMGSLKALAGLLAAHCPMPRRIGGHSQNCAALRSLANLLHSGERRRRSRAITAVKTSTHPTTRPNPAGKCQRQERALRLRSTVRREGWSALSLTGCTGHRFPTLSVCVSLCFSARWMSGPGAWCLVMISPTRLNAYDRAEQGE